MTNLAGLGGLATVLAGGLYGLLRLSYVVHYAQFGLAPEDVGIGPAQILTDNAVPLLLFLLVYSGAVVLIPATLLIAGIKSVPGAMRSPSGTRFRRAIVSARPLLLGGLVLVAVLYLIQGLRFVFVGPGIAKADAKCALAGYASGGQTVGLRGLTDVTFGFRSYAATVTASAAQLNDQPLSGATTRGRGPNLLLLGQSADQVVLWDPDAQAAVRAPKGEAVVKVYGNDRVGTRPPVEACENQAHPTD